MSAPAKDVQDSGPTDTGDATTMSAVDIKAPPAEPPEIGPEPDDGIQSARWPNRIQHLGRQLVTAPDMNSYRQAQIDLWCILNSAVAEYCQYHAIRFPLVSREDIEDIASNKALDLLNWIVLGKWDVIKRSPGAIASFVSKTSRNELLNLTRKMKRRVLPRDETRPAWDVSQTGEGQIMSPSPAPDAILEQREYAQALRECVEKLKPRMRRIWFLRVFSGLPSKQIATHPAVRLNSGHVDVLLQRSREALRECMSKRGYESRAVPSGALSELWDLYKNEEDTDPEDYHG